MQTAHELFLHELGDMLDAEKKLVEALGEQAEESSRPEVKKAFEMHQKQTEGQVERLQQVFEELGESPDESECKGIKGLNGEHHLRTASEPQHAKRVVAQLVAFTWQKPPQRSVAGYRVPSWER